MKRIMLGAALLALALGPAAAAGQQCRSVALPNPPSWLTSGVYDKATGTVLLVGARDAELRSYRLDKGSAVSVSTPMDVRAASGSDNFPVSIKHSDNGYLIAMTGASALQAGSDFSGARSFSLTTAANGQASGLGAVYEWLPAGQQVIGIGSVRNITRDLARDQPYKTGLFVGSLTEDGVANARAVKQRASNDDFLTGPNDYYLTGLTTLAALGDRTGYFLDLGEAPKIQVIDLESGRISGEIPMPAGFEKLPRLSVRSDGPGAFPVIQAEIEARTMPAGLTVIGQRLFLLTRQPGGPGAVKWLLHEWDPVANGYREVLRLPTTAPHLLLIGETDQDFLVVEKGPVIKWGVQEVGPLVAVPLAWLRPGSPLTSDMTPLECQRND